MKKIIKTIMKDTKEKLEKDKKYKEIFDNIIQNKGLLDLNLLFEDLKISAINTNENKFNYSNINKISALGDSKNKYKEVITELNSELTKMNYCNIIQNNTIQRLNLSISF
jgi:hypothetical protein